MCTVLRRIVLLCTVLHCTVLYSQYIQEDFHRNERHLRGMTLAQVRSGQVRLDQVRSNRIRSDLIGTLLRALPLEWVGTRTQRREMLWQHSRGSNSIIIGKQRVTGNLEENELSVRLMEPDVNWSRSSSSVLLFLLLLRLFILHPSSPPPPFLRLRLDLSLSSQFIALPLPPLCLPV